MLTIESAAELLLQGKILIFPTDTVYGIGALASYPRAIERIYTIKKRPLHKPLIALISTPPTGMSKKFNQLAAHFWPGPLTLVENGQSYRMPSHPTILNLLKLLNQPLLTTSANRSGHPPPTTPSAITIQADGLLLSDTNLSNAPSTVYEPLTDTLYRPGPITHLQLKNILSIS